VLASRESLRGIINVEKAAYKHWMVESLKAERRVLEVLKLLVYEALRFRV
jgi:hypothetical protein